MRVCLITFLKTVFSSLKFENSKTCLVDPFLKLFPKTVLSCVVFKTEKPKLLNSVLLFRFQFPKLKTRKNDKFSLMAL